MQGDAEDAGQLDGGIDAEMPRIARLFHFAEDGGEHRGVHPHLVSHVLFLDLRSHQQNLDPLARGIVRPLHT